MQTEHFPLISEKKEQTYEEAIKALKQKKDIRRKWGGRVDFTVYLTDISKKLYTEELILTALKYGKCKSFSHVPEKYRTEAVCAAAIASGFDVKDILNEIPEAQLTDAIYMAILENGDAYDLRFVPKSFFENFDVALEAVSRAPKAVDVVLAGFRHKRIDSPYSKEDLEIIAEAMCPRKMGQRKLDQRLNRSDRTVDDILNGRSLAQFSSEEAGFVSTEHMFIISQELKICAEAKNEPKAKRTPLTLEQLKKMSGQPVWVEVINHSVFADPEDDFDAWGMCRRSWVRVWDEKRADLISIDYDFETYEKDWLAYTCPPDMEE